MEIPKDRNFGLDLLRASAILIVVYQHGYDYVKLYIKRELYFLPIFDGVGVFFVLSGFLIGGILIKEINKSKFEFSDLFQFWIRRWFRTIPAYYLVLTILIVLFSLQESNLVFESLSNFSLASYYFFFQNFSMPHPNFFVEAWSLSIEEWFYLLVPFSVFLLKRCGLDSRTNLLIVIAVGIVSITLYRIYKIDYYNIADYGTWTSNIRKQVTTRLDSIMYGLFGAYLFYYKSPIWFNTKTNILAYIGLSLLLFSNLITPINPFFALGRNVFVRDYLFLTTTALGTLLLLPKIVTLKTNIRWIQTLVTYISLISYSIYLVKLTLVNFILKFIFINKIGVNDQSIFGSCSLYFAHWFVSFAIAYYMYVYFEKPSTSLREVFTKKHS